MESSGIGVSLGQNPLVKVPDRVKKYLIGDICVSIQLSNGQYIELPIEVKFRSDSVRFKKYTSLDQLSSQNTTSAANTSSVFDCQDCRIFYSIAGFISYKTGGSLTTVTCNNTQLTKELRDWAQHTNLLFLRLKGIKHWIIVEVK